jgi:hypothetical protein
MAVVGSGLDERRKARKRPAILVLPRADMEAYRPLKTLFGK